MQSPQLWEMGPWYWNSGHFPLMAGSTVSLWATRFGEGKVLQLTPNHRDLLGTSSHLGLTGRACDAESLKQSLIWSVVQEAGKASNVVDLLWCDLSSTEMDRTEGQDSCTLHRLIRVLTVFGVWKIPVTRFLEASLQSIWIQTFPFASFALLFFFYI